MLLSHESLTWFSKESFENSKNSLKLYLRHNTITREMILPRCLYSPVDAYFCAEFFELMHLFETPGYFSILHFSKIGMIGILRCVKSFSEIEAKNFSNFLRESLRIIKRWTNNKILFNKQLLSKPRIIINQKQSENTKYENQFKISKNLFICKFITHHELINHYFRHFSVELKNFALSSLLSNNFYININAINILFVLCEKWPNDKRVYEKLIYASRELMERELNRRPDIALRAQRYMLDMENKLHQKSYSKNFSSWKKKILNI
jgi:THO complex subunit 2